MDLSGSTFQPCHRLWSNGMDIMALGGQVGPPLQSPNPDLGWQWLPMAWIPKLILRRCWSKNQSNVFKGVCPKHSLSPHRGPERTFFLLKTGVAKLAFLKPPLSHLPSFVTDVWEASGNGVSPVLAKTCKNMQKLQYPNSIRKRVSSGHCIWSFWWTCWEKKLLKSPNNAPPDRGPGHGPCDFFSALGTTTGLQKFWIKVWGLEKKD